MSNYKFNYVLKKKNYKKTYNLLLNELHVSDDLEIKWKTDDKVFICRGELWNTFLLGLVKNSLFPKVVEKWYGKKCADLVDLLLTGLKEDLEWNYEMCSTNTHPDGITKYEFQEDGFKCIHTEEMN